MPKTNTEFWERKIFQNFARDKEIGRLLAAKGWRVIRVWEHEIKDSLEETVKAIQRSLVEQPVGGDPSP